VRRAALIYNPKSGRQRHAEVLETIVATLRDGGFQIELTPTAYAGQAIELARGLATAGHVEAVFSFGGDGTAREVAAGLLGSPVALGVLPGGTANLLALALGLPRNPVAAAAVLCRAPVRSFDVGLTRGATGEHPFLMMTSAGLDATVLAALDVELKWRFGEAAIIWQGLREWWRYSYPRIEVIADGERLDATFAAVANIPFYAGSFRLAPEARPDSHRLELVLFRGTGRRATMGFILDLLRSAHVRRRDVEVRHVDEVVLSGPVGGAAQIDGDLCEERLPVTVRLAAEELQVLFPQA
jgi:diacylglycerol kinase family enzyme